MKIIESELKGVYLIEPDVFGDSRGWFSETYSYENFKKQGIDTVFIQDNQSYTKEKGTIRALHFQKEPYAQTKLFRCTRGKLLDVAVDLRKESKNYLKYVAFELSAENKRQLYIPKGFAHGFLTLTDDCEVQYKVDAYYNKESDRSIRFDDKSINIDWGIKDPILSDKDKNAPTLENSDVDF